MNPSALLLTLPLFLTACDPPPEVYTDTIPCSWEKENISMEDGSGAIYRLQLGKEKEWFTDAVFVLATGSGEKDTIWTIRKASPFAAAWETRQHDGGVRPREWYTTDDAGPVMHHHIAFLGEMLTVDNDGQGITDRNGPISILGDTFSEKLNERFQGKNSTFRKISGIVIDSKHSGTVTRTFCGLAK